MTNALPPAWAPTIFIHDGALCLSCPGPTERKHLLRFPNTVEGLRGALRMLNARSMSSRIGEKGDLTQHQVQAELTAVAKRDGPKFQPRNEGARKVLEELGLI